MFINLASNPNHIRALLFYFSLSYSPVKTVSGPCVIQRESSRVSSLGVENSSIIESRNKSYIIENKTEFPSWTTSATPSSTPSVTPTTSATQGLTPTATETPTATLSVTK